MAAFILLDDLFQPKGVHYQNHRQDTSGKKPPVGQQFHRHFGQQQMADTQYWNRGLGGVYIQGNVRYFKLFYDEFFFYLDGTQGNYSCSLIWHVAYATVFDMTSSEKYTTTIDANGIYTGTVRANQMLIDSALVVGGSSYNGSISVRDAGNNVKATLDRTGITA